MTRERQTARSGEAGYSIIELLISTAIMITVTGAIFSLMAPAQGNAQAQPELADMQQRMRIGNEALYKDVMMAGAGPYQGPVTGSLINYFAPIVPRRVGDISPDPATGAASYKPDAVTLTYIPNTYSQTTISNAMPPQSAELKVNSQPNCPADAGDLCGFVEGMEVIIFDTLGNFDTFTITHVQDSAGHLQHRGQDLNYSYQAGASVTQVVSNTYYLDRTTKQLKRYDGHAKDEALVDNVVDLRFDYFGDPNPPKFQIPPPIGVANCLYDVSGNLALPVLTADAGSLATLTSTQLSNGPYCGAGDNQFDADLLRIRKVRVTLRVQAASPTLRGASTALFMNPGTAQGGDRYVPDYRLSFDISPRNLNLAR